MSTEATGVSVHGTVTIAPENLPKFMEAFQPLYDQVAAEPECTFFEVFQQPDNPGVISWVENWTRPAEWLMQNQLPKDYYRSYFAVTEAMYVKPREIRIFKRLGAPFVMTKRGNGGWQE
ncbi:hypothetical protein BJX76DRAFT_360893 [Aspergillus varians]